MSSSNGARPIPYVILLNQPNPFYHMRPKGDKRSTFLVSENISSSFCTDPITASSFASFSNKKSSILRKKNATVSEDGLESIYPKIKVNIRQK